MFFSGIEKELIVMGFEAAPDGSYLIKKNTSELMLRDLKHEKLSQFEFNDISKAICVSKFFPKLWIRSKQETIHVVKQYISYCEKSNSNDDLKKWKPDFSGVKKRFGSRYEL